MYECWPTPPSLPSRVTGICRMDTGWVTPRRRCLQVIPVLACKLILLLAGCSAEQPRHAAKHNLTSPPIPRHVAAHPEPHHAAAQANAANVDTSKWLIRGRDAHSVRSEAWHACEATMRKSENAPS